jgi:hypothetical protein
MTLFLYSILFPANGSTCFTYIVAFIPYKQFYYFSVN